MAISGPNALKKLDEALRDIRSEEQKISRLLARSSERSAKLKETQSALFRQLANAQLEGVAREEIGEQFSRAEKQAHSILEKHDVLLNDVENQLKKLDAQVASKATKRHEILNELNQAQEKLVALKDKIKKQIEKNPKFETLQKKVENLKIIAEQSIKKTEIAQKDSEEKGKPYKNDPLFMYLWDRKYGTSEYKVGNLTRWLDGKVARLVKYNDARPNFAMLNEIPLRLSEHALYQSELEQKAQEALDRLEQKAVDEAGGKPMRLTLEKAQKELSAFDIEMAQSEDERDELAQQYQLLAEGQTPAFEEASNLLSANLQNQTISTLFERARRTSNSKDDILVKKIDGIIASIKEGQVDNKSYKKRLKTLAIRRRELEEIEWEFKKSRFDDPRSSFSKNSLTGSLLSEFLSGAISAAIYWQQF
ncbi:MAG: hypothetical protein L3J15_07220, partial [Devosiaceae bacterium]|nr:hypothetical protein [Devosiaceae bacterium]